MDFDQILETWNARNATPRYEVNSDALLRTLQTEEARVRQEQRLRRRGLMICWIIGTGVAIWSGFWIAITITNGWPAIYAIASLASLGLFALAAGALWASRGREQAQNIGNTLQAEVRRALALVDYQLSVTGRGNLPMLGTVSLIIGTGLFSWTINKSQDIADMSSGVGWFLFTVIFVAWITWGAYKQRGEIRETRGKLELRQQRLRDLLAALDSRD